MVPSSTVGPTLESLEPMVLGPVHSGLPRTVLCLRAVDRDPKAGTPQAPAPQIPSYRDHKALNRATFGV